MHNHTFRLFQGHETSARLDQESQENRVAAVLRSMIDEAWNTAKTGDHRFTTLSKAPLATIAERKTWPGTSKATSAPDTR